MITNDFLQKVFDENVDELDSIQNIDRKYLNHRGKKRQDHSNKFFEMVNKYHCQIESIEDQAKAYQEFCDSLYLSQYIYNKCLVSMEFDEALNALKNGAKIQRLGWGGRFWKECNGGIKEYYEQYIGYEFHVSERSVLPDDDDLMATDWLVREE